MAEDNAKWKIFIGPAVTLAIVFGGFIAQYATTRAELSDFKEDVIKIDQKIEMMETKVHTLELKSAVASNTLETVKSDVATIKKDVKSLLDKVILK
jgi:predicted  nucleic acid-binding Zn-ribbon protein